MVHDAVVLMRTQSSMSKVVLSRCMQQEVLRFDPTLFFENLCNAYPQAFVYVVSSAQTGTWIGASPELLLQLDGNTCKTVALAGTRPASTTGPWPHKETDEQQQVERYIENVLTQQQLAFKKHGPQNRITGDLMHLCTEFEGSALSNNNSSITRLLEALNPTPAVCGMPRHQALDFISKHEGYYRNFYSGFTGVMNNNKLNAYVNLRCLEWQNNQVTLFAGAGITKDSDAEAEYRETAAKMQAIGRFLQHR